MIVRLFFGLVLFFTTTAAGGQAPILFTNVHVFDGKRWPALAIASPEGKLESGGRSVASHAHMRAPIRKTAGSQRIGQHVVSRIKIALGKIEHEARAAKISLDDLLELR